VAGNSYTQLLKSIEDLIATGTKISDATAGTPAVQIHDWINRAEYYLSLLEDKLPTAVSDFRRIRQSFEFKVEEDEDGSSSASAYRPKGGDVLLDFSFEHLQQANNILKLAAAKLEIEASSSAGGFSDETLGQQLRTARGRAGHSQRKAADEIGYDPKTISEWERGDRKPHPEAEKNIRDYIHRHLKPHQS